jgi:hypothetical protein
MILETLDIEILVQVRVWVFAQDAVKMQKN